MVLMLPFLTGALAAWCGFQGKRSACFMLWVATLAVLAAGASRHMHGVPSLAL
ncbi:DUF5993 family protein [Bordetella sp. 2513F-2]